MQSRPGAVSWDSRFSAGARNSDRYRTGLSILQRSCDYPNPISCLGLCSKKSRCLDSGPNKRNLASSKACSNGGDGGSASGSPNHEDPVRRRTSDCESSYCRWCSARACFAHTRFARARATLGRPAGGCSTRGWSVHADSQGAVPVAARTAQGSVLLAADPQTPGLFRPGDRQQDQG